MRKRCQWASAGGLIADYHDREWGVPVHDDRRLFEHLLLDVFQAGLSWEIILRKRENFREAFDGFDARTMAAYGPEKIESLLQNRGIVRNRKKIEAAVRNARAFLDIQEEFGSFSAYVWGFVGGRPLQNHWRSLAELPSRSPESEAMSRDLKRRGFAFLGPTVCYAFMQAAGLVNDHTTDCFRHRELAGA
jgi:DNA-3-methyladenine glycosylase I